MGGKSHLPASNQLKRWVGSKLHNPRYTIVTRYGLVENKVYLRRYMPRWVVEDVENATCKTCLHSYGREELGLSGRMGSLSEAQKELDRALAERTAAGLPLSNEDLRAIRWLDKLLGGGEA